MADRTPKHGISRKADPRRIAVTILNRVDSAEAFAEPLLDKALSSHGFDSPSDRGLLTQLVYGTLRMRGALDWVIGRLYEGSFASLDTRLKNILRVGLYQIHYMDRIPAYAAVDEAVETAKTDFPGRSGLVNALLRNAIRERESLEWPDPVRSPARHISVVFSHPLWLVEKWIGIYGVEETARLCRADNDTPPLTLRVNRLKANREDLCQRFLDEGHRASPTKFSPDGLVLSGLAQSVRDFPPYRKGYIQVQDEASQMVSYLLNPSRGEKIADLCCGSGGKGTHLAERMGDGGKILAIDLNAGKIRQLESNARRLGISIIQSRRADVTAPPRKPDLAGYDRVLIDAPCSGLGTLRRNPEIKWRLSERDLLPLTVRQLALLVSASLYVKKRGQLVYSTCSTLPEENEDIVESFLTRHPDFRRADPPETIPREMTDERGFFRTMPHRHGTDGFFGAVLTRT